MRIVRLIKHAGIVALSGIVGFLIASGGIPDRLSGTSRELATQARDTTEALRQEEMTVTGALNYVRGRVLDGIRLVAGFLDD